MKKSVILDGAVEGAISYVNVVGRFTIDGASNREVQIPLNFEMPQGARPKLAIIDFTVFGKGGLKKWRANISNFSLTKEFKPLQMWEDGEKWIAKFIYDVTAIFNLITREPILRVHAIPDGILKVVQASMVIVYEDPEIGQTNYKYIVSVEPTLNFLEKWEREYNHLKSTILAPSEITAEATLRFGLCESRILIPPESPSEVEIECSAKSFEVISKEPIIPLNIMVTKETLKEAKIEINEIRVENGKVEVIIENKGEGDAEKVVVVLYDWGKIIDRKIVGEMKGGERRNIKLTVEGFERKKMEGINIRIIWSYKGVTRFIEKRVSVKGSVPG